MSYIAGEPGRGWRNFKKDILLSLRMWEQFHQNEEKNGGDTNTSIYRSNPAAALDSDEHQKDIIKEIIIFFIYFAF